MHCFQNKFRDEYSIDILNDIIIIIITIISNNKINYLPIEINRLITVVLHRVD